jgi:predicted acyltransferase
MTSQPLLPAKRLPSVDAYRGFVMFLMMAEILRLPQVARHFPDNTVWQWLAFNQTHVEWAGCSLHDLIQPSFSFLVGVALPFSIAARQSRGQGFGRMLFHATWRALVLVLLGVFLRSVGQKQTRFTFEDTLSQIGLGYVPLFLLGFARPRWQWTALVVILIGYWAAFALYPLPGPDAWPYDPTTFNAHWDKNTNLAWKFDQWFLNLFPRETPFTENGGGYSTLSFIPTLGTMLLGLIAGRWLKDGPTGIRMVFRLLVAGVIGLGLGMALDQLGICPVVKRIWTPSWTIYSGGWCFLLLAGFYIVIEWIGFVSWSFPLRVIGMNSIAIYVLVHLIDSFIIGSFRTHLGQDIFNRLGETYTPLLAGGAALVVFWLLLYWMYRRNIFLKI